jgi:integrase
MTTPRRMTQRVREYLALRRAFGFQLTIAGQQLQRFARFADRVAPGKPLTTEIALRWAQSSLAKKPTSAARRLLLLRPFARYLRTMEPLTEIPPQRLIGRAQYRPTPHIFTVEEIRALLAAADRLRPRGGLRPQSMRAYLSLLLCTGMRPPEPLRLTRADVDWTSHTLTIRRTKFSKSRIVVLHRTATQALQAYARARDRHVPLPQSDAFFLGDDGRALTVTKARWAFCRLRRQLGWTQQSDCRRPRLYDLRHTFVCGRLLAWYQAGVDVDVAFPALSTYLGHVKVTDTYWYVTAVPALMQTISARFERFLGTRSGGRV